MTDSQRRFPRIASTHAVLVTKLDGAHEDFALTKTIAVGGCCVISNDSVGVGKAVELLIAIDREHVIKTRGKVVYERPLDDGRWELGVAFAELDADAARRIEQLFERGERPQATL